MEKICTKCKIPKKLTEFTPIHNFVPRKGQFDDLGKTPFIALTAGGKSNYES